MSSFVARCTFCGQRFRAPEHAIGASMRCLGCGEFFTLAPAGQAAQPMIGAEASDEPGPPCLPVANAEAVGPADAVVRPVNLPGAGAAAGGSRLARAPHRQPRARVELGALRPLPERRGATPAAVLALLTSAAALLCAASLRFCPLVVPLSVLALASGILAVLLSVATGGPRRLLSAAAAAAGTAMVTAALLAPGFLGLTYKAWRERNDAGPTVRRLIPIPGRPSGGAAEQTEWADAARFALQEGPVRVQVASCTTGSLEAAPAKDSSREYLVIWVRTLNVQGGREFAASRGIPPSPRDERNLPTLSDNLGRSYARHSVPGGDPAEVRSSNRFPVNYADEAFVFDPPSPGIECLRLEVPMAHRGIAAPFRFSVPLWIVRMAAPGKSAFDSRPGR